jgi:hypothetical protein
LPRFLARQDEGLAHKAVALQPGATFPVFAEFPFERIEFGS